MTVDIETLVDLIADKREWIRRQAIYTLEEALPVLAQGHQDTLQKIITAFEQKLVTVTEPEIREKMEGLLEIMHSLMPHQPA